MNWVIIVLGVCSNAFASVLIKLAVTEPRKFPNITDPASAFTNWPFWLGLFFYGTAFLLYAQALSKLQLNVAHPILTTGSVALVAILSVIVFKEPFYWFKAIGVILVIIGVAFITAEAS